MYCPPLCSSENPFNHEWAEPQLSDDERLNLRRRLALIVGYDPSNHKIHVLGSGFIISLQPQFIVLTAAHVLIEFLNQVYGPAPRTALSEGGSDPIIDGQRLKSAVRDKLFKVVLEGDLTSNEVILTPFLVTMGEPRGADGAILWLEPPKEADYAVHFDALPVDLDEIDPSSQFAMAGFAKMPLQIPIGSEHQFSEMRTQLIIRAARIVEVTDRAEGTRNGIQMYRMPMPSEPGMSGGPLIRFRTLTGRRPVSWVLTAAGVISRSKYDGNLRYYETPAGSTWVVPMRTIGWIPVRETVRFGHVLATSVFTYHEFQTEHSRKVGARGEPFDLRPILREKVRVYSLPRIAQYRQMLGQARDHFLDIRDIPFPKDYLEFIILAALNFTTANDERNNLEQLCLSISRWQALDAGADNIRASAERERQAIQQSLDELERVNSGLKMPWE